jgi:thiamine-monophosphate kinase
LPSEFELIERCFKRRTDHTLLGIGDDGALIVPTAGHELVVSTDLLVEGTHFFADADAEDLGWKTLAVNVSDMAAMGAKARWATLGIAVPPSLPKRGFPSVTTFSWLDDFARGFFACADEFGVDLIGGDTTRGPRCFAVTIMGEVPAGQALRRSGAQPGDQIWVSGRPGRAACGLAHLQGTLTLTGSLLADCLAALHRPQPRVALGLALRAIASAAIDVSDGLLADLGHILDESRCSATLDSIPADADAAYLTGGDDYELVFTADPARVPEINALAEQLQLPLTCLGQIDSGAPGSLRVIDSSGRDITPPKRGFDHFR